MQHIYQDIKGWFDFDNVYRDMIARIPSQQPAHFVEIGSFLGRSAAFMAVEIVNSGKQIRFDAVDPWINEHYLDPNDAGQLAYGKGGKQLAAGESVYRIFLRNTFPLLPYFTPIKLPSVEASVLYQDASLDFVFIDGDHRYESVKADIAAWQRKIKPGGILAGHDYGHKNHSGVKQAVDEIYGTDVKFPRHNVWLKEL